MSIESCEEAIREVVRKSAVARDALIELAGSIHMLGEHEECPDIQWAGSEQDLIQIAEDLVIHRATLRYEVELTK